MNALTLPPSIVGARLKPYRTHVDWRQTTNFAAGIGDANPRYLDDTREEGLVAPPTYAVAVSWPLLAAIQDYIDVELRPELLLGMVHYSEVLEIHRLIRPADSLRLDGHVAALLPHRKGSYLVLRLDAVDDRERLVHTEWIGALLRGVSCEGKGIGADVLPSPPKPAVELPDTPRWEALIEVPPQAPWVYDAASGIEFAIHTSRAFALQVGLPGPILQGTASLAMAVRELINREADGVPERLELLSARFLGMIEPGLTGTEIRIQLLARREQDLYFRVLNAAGKTAIGDGYARFSA